MPRKITVLASPMAPTVLMPIVMPRMTMPVLIYHSGFAATDKKAAAFGKKLPIISPTAKAMTKPSSPRPKDQEMPNFSKVFIDVFIGIWAFVLAIVWSIKKKKKKKKKRRRN